LFPLTGKEVFVDFCIQIEIAACSLSWELA